MDKRKLQQTLQQPKKKQFENHYKKSNNFAAKIFSHFLSKVSGTKIQIYEARFARNIVTCTNETILSDFYTMCIWTIYVNIRLAKAQTM